MPRLIEIHQYLTCNEFMMNLKSYAEPVDGREGMVRSVSCRIEEHCWGFQWAGGVLNDYGNKVLVTTKPPFS